MKEPFNADAQFILRFSIVSFASDSYFCDFPSNTKVLNIKAKKKFASEWILVKRVSKMGDDFILLLTH